jgi:hypothetical protein
MPAMTGNTNRRISVQACLGIKRDPISKVINMKRAGRVAQVIEYLPSKCEALSSTSNTTPLHTHTKYQMLYIKQIYHHLENGPLSTIAAVVCAYSTYQKGNLSLILNLWLP